MAFLLDEDDGSALEAALSLVDEYSNATPPSHEPSTTSLETDITPSFSVNCMEMSTMVPLSKSMCSNAKFSCFNDEGERPLFKTSKKRNPNKLRDEVQFELVYLRGKVNELETKLRSLQLSSSAKQILQVPRPIPAPRVWEEIAKRQRRQCDVAQHEHAQLKVLVERKHKKVLGLCETLQKRLHTQNNKYLRITNASASQKQSVQVLDFRGDIQDFQDLFRRMEIAYHEQVSIFAANGLSGIHSKNPTNVVHVREINDTQVEVFVSKLLPFSLHETSAVVWDHFKGIEKHLDNGGLYGKSMKNLEQPFTILEDFTKLVLSNRLRADVQVKQIVRRCVESNRDMILFVSSIHPTEGKHSAIEGLVFHAQEYVLTKRVDGCDLTLLQFCGRVSTESKPGFKFDTRYIRSGGRFWMRNLVGNIQCYLDRIEDALVDKALMIS